MGKLRRTEIAFFNEHSDNDIKPLEEIPSQVANWKSETFIEPPRISVSLNVMLATVFPLMILDDCGIENPAGEDAPLVMGLLSRLNAFASFSLAMISLGGPDSMKLELLELEDKDVWYK